MPRIYQKKLVVDGLTPVGIYAALRAKAGLGCFLLESVVPGERWGRYSVLGYRPQSHVGLFGEPGIDPFTRLAELIPARGDSPKDVAERFAGAHVGLISYDMVHFVTKVEQWPGDAHVKEPIARLVGNATVIVFDNLTHTATIASTDADAVAEADADLAQVEPLTPIASPDFEVSAGAGVVADSVPEVEAKQTRNKARAALAAVTAARKDALARQRA